MARAGRALRAHPLRLAHRRGAAARRRRAARRAGATACAGGSSSADRAAGRAGGRGRERADEPGPREPIAARRRREAPVARRREARRAAPRALRCCPTCSPRATSSAGFYAIVQAFSASRDLDRAGSRSSSRASSTCSTAASRAWRGHQPLRHRVRLHRRHRLVRRGARDAGLQRRRLQELGRTGWVLAFMFTACAALRLARFNVTPGRYRGRFEGLAEPGGRGHGALHPVVRGFLRESGIAFDVPGSGPLAGGRGAARPADGEPDPVPQLQGASTCAAPTAPWCSWWCSLIAVILSKPSVTLFFLIGIAYVSSGPVEWWWRRRTGRLEEIARPRESASPSHAAPGEGRGARHERSQDKRLRIFDTTLRDGEQSPGCSMNLNREAHARAPARAPRRRHHRGGLPDRQRGRLRGGAAIARAAARDQSICGLARTGAARTSSAPPRRPEPAARSRASTPSSRPATSTSSTSCA